MAITNQDRVGKALELLKAGLAPFVDREVMAAVKTNSVQMATVQRYAEDPILSKKPISQWDAAGLLKLMWEVWNDVFGRTLGRAERSLVSELRDVRNQWAHQTPFSSDDADRALDSMARLLTAVSAPQADDVNKMKLELRRTIYDQQVHDIKKRNSEALAYNGLVQSWPEIVRLSREGTTGSPAQASLFAPDEE